MQVGVVANACNHSRGEMGQEDPKFQVILGDTENLMLAQSTWNCIKKIKKMKKEMNLCNTVLMESQTSLLYLPVWRHLTEKKKLSWKIWSEIAQNNRHEHYSRQRSTRKARSFGSAAPKAPKPSIHKWFQWSGLDRKNNRRFAIWESGSLCQDPLVDRGCSLIKRTEQCKSWYDNKK